MYAAIQTKFLPCTNYRPSRVKAWSQAGSIVLSWDYALDVGANHEKAAKALAAKLEWNTERYGELVGGALPNGGYAFTFKRPANRDSYIHSQMSRIVENDISVRFSDAESNATNYMNITREQFNAIRAILGGI